MGWMHKVGDNIRKGIRNWLQIVPAGTVQITELRDFEQYAICNRIWYRGESDGLEQLYRQSHAQADRYKFWASKCTPGMEMRKIHTGLPALIVRTLSSIVLADRNDFEFARDTHRQLWEEIAKDNKFPKKLEKSLKEALVVGDGAFKITIDTRESDYPILEWYSGERIELVYRRDRLKEVVFKTAYAEDGKQYVLHEHYGYGYIQNHLYKGEQEVPLNSIPATENIRDVVFDSSLILAVPLKVYESIKYEGRGGSVFDGKLDSFDAFDEAWSQWMDALRAGRAKTYIPDCLVPRDPETGKAMKPNPFDNRYFAADGDSREGQKNEISTEQPAIPYDSYQASYATALDLCLQGIISPSTLGIDMKKLDNALAQREKEKTTLYTRDAIINALQEALPELVAASINACNILNKKAVEDVEVVAEWGEYANPSFEAQIEAISKARQSGIMSLEKTVDELYGDSMDDKCKAEEVARLKAEQGIAELEEPALNMEGVYLADEGKSREQDVPDGEGEVPGASGAGKRASAPGDLRGGKE